jgi:uncharacterized membrane protein (UPF0127 family)
LEPSIAGASAPKRSRIFVLIALSVLLLTGSWFMMNQKDAETIIVTFPTGMQLETEVADTPEKIFFGLAFREGLPSNSGMLYIFETSDRHLMRTKGFKIPVDMIWADESRHIVHVIANVDPCEKDPCPSYGPPPENARYVIQAAAGFIAQEHVVPGMELKFTLRM